jgi:hypothetical protein
MDLFFSFFFSALRRGPDPGAERARLRYTAGVLFYSLLFSQLNSGGGTAGFRRCFAGVLLVGVFSDVCSRGPNSFGSNC